MNSEIKNYIDSQILRAKAEIYVNLQIKYDRGDNYNRKFRSESLNAALIDRMYEDILSGEIERKGHPEILRKIRDTGKL